MNSYEKIMEVYGNADLKIKSYEDLVRECKELEEEIAGNWLAPMLNGFFVMMFFHLLRKKIEGSAIEKEHPNFVNDILFNSGGVVSMDLVRNTNRLIASIGANKSAREVFENNPAGKIVEILRSGYTNLWDDIQDHINKYGERGEEGELKFENNNYKDDPLKFIDFIRQHLQFQSSHGTIATQQTYRQIIQAYCGVNLIKRAWLLFIIRVTVNRVRDRENFRFMRTKSLYLFKTRLRRMGELLKQEGHISQNDDLYYLNYHDLLSRDKISLFKTLVHDNRTKYASYATMPVNPRYHQFGDSYVAVEPDTIISGDLKGTGCCSGTVSGEVILVNTENFREVDPEGKILVAEFFEPGWIALLTQAKGLISERGSLLSHTAILCREMGKPSIVGVKRLRQRVSNGSMVKMNGSNGKIEILNEGSV